MTFAAPLFLLAALAAAIPVVLHMMNRRKAKDMPFPTLRFLKLSAEKTRRRRRIHDVLLMAIRAAVLLLVAVGLARPAVTSLSALWGGAHTAAVVILDNSASMGMTDQDRVRFETAVAAALQVLDQLTAGDQVAILPTCGPPFPDSGKLDRTQDSARQILQQCRVSHEKAELTQKVAQARELLEKSEAANKQIYVLTDMQRASWNETEGRRGKGVGRDGEGSGFRVKGVESGESRVKSGEKMSTTSPPSPLPLIPSSSHPSSLIPHPSSAIHRSASPIIIVDCNRAPKPNVAVVGIEIETTAPVAGVPVKIAATLQNTSSAVQRRVAELVIDGVKEASSPELNLPAEGRAKHEFIFSFPRGGLHRGEVHLAGDDGSKYDDRRFFTIEIDQGIPVAIVKSQRHEIAYIDDAYYLERALAAGSAGGGAIRTATLLAGELASEPLEKYRVVFCVNLPALEPEAADRLRAYIEGGGNVVWICGDDVKPDAYNQMNEQSGGRLLPAALVDVRIPGRHAGRDSWHIGSLDKTHPALGRLVEPAALYESVLVYKHVRMAADGQARILARLDDGEPLLVERNLERGRVLMLGTSVHVNWSNLPLRPIFLPLLTQLMFDLAGADQARSNLIAGQPLVLQLARATQSVDVEVVLASGETLRLKTTKPRPAVAPANEGQTFLYPNTHEIGIYLLRVLDGAHPTPIAQSVNFDPDEADPAKIERKELQEQLGGGPVVFADNPDDLTSTFAWLREGKSLWGLFLTAVLIALVFETFVSNRLSPKHDAAAVTRV